MNRSDELTAGVTPTEGQRRFWDWHWGAWQAPAAVNTWARRRADVMLHFIRSLALRRPRILDLGCGTGWFTHELSQVGEATGLDLSEHAIARARANYPHVTFLAGNIAANFLAPGCFDVVVSQEVLQHVEDQGGFVRAIADVLSAGGYFLLTTPNQLVVNRLNNSARESRPGLYQKYLSVRALKRLLATRFRLLRATSVVPMGDRGFLRLINSPRLNRAISRLVPERRLQEVKERQGLGLFLVILAQRR